MIQGFVDIFFQTCTLKTSLRHSSFGPHCKCLSASLSDYYRPRRHSGGICCLFFLVFFFLLACFQNHLRHESCRLKYVRTKYTNNPLRHLARCCSQLCCTQWRRCDARCCSCVWKKGSWKRRRWATLRWRDPAGSRRFWVVPTGWDQFQLRMRKEPIQHFWWKVASLFIKFSLQTNIIFFAFFLSVFAALDLLFEAIAAMLTLYSAAFNCDTIEKHRYSIYTLCQPCDRQTRRKLCFAAASLGVDVEVHCRQVFNVWSPFFFSAVCVCSPVAALCWLLNAEWGSEEKRPVISFLLFLKRSSSPSPPPLSLLGGRDSCRSPIHASQIDLWRHGRVRRRRRWQLRRSRGGKLESWRINITAHLKWLCVPKTHRLTHRQGWNHRRPDAASLKSLTPKRLDPLNS